MYMVHSVVKINIYKIAYSTTEIILAEMPGYDK